MKNALRWLRGKFFQHYWWIAIVGSAAVIFYFNVIREIEKRWEVSVAVVGSAAGLVYFVQKQKLEEMQLFERLFTQFNKRYECLHDKLQAVARLDREAMLSPEQLDALDQYFNLCAEEYLFYDEGRILPCVWKSWCRGMQFYLRCNRISEFWRHQQESGSHYGLTTEHIEQGARRD